MSEQETFNEHGTEFMPGDKVRVVKGDDKGPTIYTVTHYTRNDSYQVREPVHNTTVEFYANQLEKVGKKGHKQSWGFFDDLHKNGER
jgi:hypothetical protein